MKKIDIAKMLNDNNLQELDRKEFLGMEFIKQPNGTYIIKNSNGRVVSEKEKRSGKGKIKKKEEPEENNELVLEDIKKDCAKDITKKISKNKKRIKEIEEKENVVLEETNSTLE